MANPWFRNKRTKERVFDGKRWFYSLNKDEFPGYVYLISCFGFHKIGRTINIKQRLSSIANANPHKVVLIHSVQTKNFILLEQILHDTFKDYRKRGEWYKFPPELVRVIKEMTNYING